MRKNAYQHLSKHFVNLINEELASLFPSQSDEIKILNDACLYALLSPGKRLRPLIPVLIAEENNCFSIDHLRAALSLELVHTYSLIHDDLPCMDDDDYRRGKPTLHKAYSEAIAVLSGDNLLTYAFENITNQTSLSPQEKIRYIELLATCSGSQGLIGGQILDLYGQESKRNIRELEKTHSLKTANLFIASFGFGAIMTKASEQDNKNLKAIGHCFGMLFQYLDDFQDFLEDKKEEKFNSMCFFSEKEIKQRITFYLNHLDTLFEQTNKKTSQIQEICKELFRPLMVECYV